MTAQPIRLHAQTHLPNGSDPVAFEGIQFNVDNEGGWLYIITNSSTDIDYGTLGIAIVDKSGQGLALLCDPSGGQFGIQIQSASASIGSPAGGPVFAVNESGIVRVTLRATNKLQVVNHLSAAIFEVREDGSVHIPTGTSVIADL